MKIRMTFALMALLMIGLAGCGGDDGVVGEWTVDLDHFKSVMKATPGVPQDDAELQKAVDQMKDGMVFTFKKDGTFTASFKNPMTGKVDSESGTWKLDGEKLTITGKKGDKDETKTVAFDGDSIHMKDEKVGMDVKLKRK